MPEFLSLLSPDEALAIWLGTIPFRLPDSEKISTRQALGRVTTSAVISYEALPPFTRSTVDGYAVRAADTHGASESLPGYLTIIGEVLMGKATDLCVRPGECAVIHTGGMIPPGADAVVMMEYTQAARTGEVEVLRAVANGENIILVGEDVQPGQEVIPAGRRLRAPEIGGLMSLGYTTVNVARPPRVGILSSGDEVVPPEAQPGPGQVRDANSYALAALIEQHGGEAALYGIMPDRPEELEETMRRAMLECDLVVVTAGSSASARDLTAEVIGRMGKPGVLVHGVNTRPGKPTILAVCDGKPVVGLPGNPVSALVIAWWFLVPLLERWLGMPLQARPQIGARLKVNVSSQAGRVDWVPVRLVDEDGERWADPIFYKSNLIFMLARADGLVRIPADANGLPAGELVQVWLL
ncbi:MAG TPA: gephyrin-like molybdotransferase Glp [Anaerolineaceae bacterium]|nr:gephyrin-like molybdotransferase Glp [Anaerolineaceae bacterium]